MYFFPVCLFVRVCVCVCVAVDSLLYSKSLSWEMKSPECTHKVANTAFHSASALQLSCLVWSYCVSAVSHGSFLATANQNAEKAVGECKTQGRPNLRHTRFIWLSNQCWEQTTVSKGSIRDETTTTVNSIFTTVHAPKTCKHHACNIWPHISALKQSSSVRDHDLYQ